MTLQISFPVLLADDNRTMIRIVRALLRQIGLEDVDEAGDGAAALELARQRTYGLIISDWNMQPVSGLELLRQIRADSRTRATPFIMATAESKTDNVIAARKAGASAYIVKPFTAQILRAKIERVCAH